MTEYTYFVSDFVMLRKNISLNFNYKSEKEFLSRNINGLSAGG